MTQSNAQKIEVAIIEADQGCQLCANFKTAACPAFQKMQQTLQVSERELSQAIEDHQGNQGQELKSCANDPSEP